MGKHRNGIVGGFSGKVGPVVGSSWKNIEVMKARPKIVKGRKVDPALLAQRAKFKVAIEFARLMKQVIKLGYPEATQLTSRNAAVASLLAKAVAGDYPDYYIVHKNAQVSKGGLSMTSGFPATSTEAGKINFTWQNTTGVGDAADTDKAVLIAFCEEMKGSMFTANGGLRKDEAGVLNTKVFSGKKVHTWLTFINAKGDDAADSLYTGEITVL